MRYEDVLEQLPKGKKSGDIFYNQNAFLELVNLESKHIELLKHLKDKLKYLRLSCRVIKNKNPMSRLTSYDTKDTIEDIKSMISNQNIKILIESIDELIIIHEKIYEIFQKRHICFEGLSIVFQKSIKSYTNYKKTLNLFRIVLLK